MPLPMQQPGHSGACSAHLHRTGSADGRRQAADGRRAERGEVPPQYRYLAINQRQTTLIHPPSLPHIIDHYGSPLSPRRRTAAPHFTPAR